MDDEWMVAITGTCIHIQPGIPHAVKVSDGLKKVRMLMIFQPAGFDGLFAELGAMSDADFADENIMANFCELDALKY
jgi:hypothetical protein